MMQVCRGQGTAVQILNRSSILTMWWRDCLFSKERADVKIC